MHLSSFKRQSLKPTVDLSVAVHAKQHVGRPELGLAVLIIHIYWANPPSLTPATEVQMAQVVVYLQ